MDRDPREIPFEVRKVQIVNELSGLCSGGIGSAGLIAVADQMRIFRAKSQLEIVRRRVVAPEAEIISDLTAAKVEVALAIQETRTSQVIYPGYKEASFQAANLSDELLTGYRSYPNPYDQVAARLGEAVQTVFETIESSS